MVPHPDRVDVIRRRVYTHHSRIAGAFRSGRLLLAGDAAHLMPVWQGQGYNSGIRDAANLGWKLAAVVSGRAGDGLLDTYDVERRKHARAMIDLSTMVGRVISPTNRRVAAARDLLVRSASIVPSLKRYVLEMRFKPMPRYEQGAVVHRSESRATPIRRSAPCSSSPGSTPGRSRMSCWTTCWAPGSPCCAGTTTRARSSATRPSRAGKHWAHASLRCARSTQLHWTGARRPRRRDRRRSHRRSQSLVRRPPGIGGVPAPRSVHRGGLYRPARARPERLAARRPHPHAGRG